MMKQALLAILAGVLLIGCSKDGSKSKLMDGGSIAAPAPEETPTPTDANFPEPDGLPAK